MFFKSLNQTFAQLNFSTDSFSMQKKLQYNEIQAHNKFDAELDSSFFLFRLQIKSKFVQKSHNFQSPTV